MNPIAKAIRDGRVAVPSTPDSIKRYQAEIRFQDVLFIDGPLAGTRVSLEVTGINLFVSDTAKLGPESRAEDFVFPELEDGETLPPLKEGHTHYRRAFHKESYAHGYYIYFFWASGPLPEAMVIRNAYHAAGMRPKFWSKRDWDGRVKGKAYK